MTPETTFIVSIIVWPFMAYFTEFLKNRFWIEKNASMLIIAVLCGILYTAYTMYVPEATKLEIMSFVLAAAGTSHLVYQTVIKKKR